METPALGKASAVIDRAEFSRLIREHHRPLLAYARVLAIRDHIAEEIVQETFVAAWQALGKFDITRDFGAWLRGIARNKWKDQCRRCRREVPLDEESLSRLEGAMHSWAGTAGEPEILDRLACCRQHLPDSLAAAVRQFYDHGQNGEAAALALAISPATLRKRLERARLALRKCLEQS